MFHETSQHPLIGIMPVIKDHSPFGLGIMPDHAYDRGAARLDPGASDHRHINHVRKAP